MNPWISNKLAYLHFRIFELVSIETIKLDSGAKRAVLIASGVICLTSAYFFAKWGFANTASIRPDSPEVAVLAAELAPDDPQTHYAAAVLLEKTFVPEDVQRSLAELEKATSLSPNNYLLWLELGKARERSGDQPGAESALRKSLQLAPNYAAVHWTLGNALLRAGKADEAFDEIRKAVAGDPAYTNVAASTAWAILGGDMARVRAALGDSTQLNAALATLLSGQKRFDEAFDVWNAIGTDEKNTTQKPRGEVLLRQLVEAGKYRLARRVAAEIGMGTEYGGSAGEISNGGFEDILKMQNAGIFEWRIADGPGPRIGPTDGQKSSGNYSLLMSFGAENKAFRQVSQTMAVEPGRTYELELSYRSDLKTTATFKWEIADASGGKAIIATLPITNNADWTSLQAVFAIPENTEGVVLRLVRENCDAVLCSVSGNLWFDDFRLKSH